MELDNIENNTTVATSPTTVKIEGSFIRIGGNQLPLYSGSLDYWRIPVDKWSGILDRILGMGFQFVSIAIPWNIHEVAKDLFDFGTTNPQRNLEEFLRLCHQRNLSVLVRPGPCVNAELSHHGFPKRIGGID